MSNFNNNPNPVSQSFQQQQQRPRYDDCPVVRAQQQGLPYYHLTPVDGVAYSGYSRVIQQKQMGVRRTPK